MPNVIETERFQSLKQLSCFKDYNLINVEALQGGFSHQVYKVTCASQQVAQAKTASNQPHLFVAKLIEGKATAQAEIGAANLAYRQGITADIIYSDSTWLITRYTLGSTLEALTVTVDEKLALCLPLMAKFHRNYVDNIEDCALFSSLNVTEVIKALQSRCHLTESQHALLSAIICEYQVISDEQHKKVLVHGDLNFANVMKVSKSKLNNPSDAKHDSAVLIDFEAAAIADVEYDLGMLQAINRITPKALASNLKHYENNSGININLVTRYAILSCLINGLWYLGEISGQCEVFKLKAHQQFDFFDLLTNKKHNLLKQMR